MPCLEGWTGLSGEACLQVSSECGKARHGDFTHCSETYIGYVLQPPVHQASSRPQESYFTVHFVYIVWDFCNISNRQSLELLKTCMVEHLHSLHSA